MIITAIILNYKNYQDVYDCIISLEKQKLPANHRLDILVIDNFSEDNNTNRLQKDFPRYKYIFNSENYGFAKGVNQGIKASQQQSDYFLLVNNDAILKGNCLELLLSESQEKNIVGPAICYKNKPDTIWQGGGFFSKLKMSIDVPDKNKPYSPQTSKPVDFLSGCIMLIPKSIISTIGMFDEQFFFYGEDLDFCLRAKENNINPLYCPKALAFHNIEDISVSRTSAFVLNNLAFSYLLIIKKHFYNLRYYGLFLLIFLYTPFRLYQIIKGKNQIKNINAWFIGARKAWQLKI